MLSHAELLARVALASGLGAAVGYERDRHGKTAGLRTHAIAAMAAATFMVVSSQFVYFQHYLPGDLVVVDPSRIAAAVVTGTGFLAAGAILRTGVTVQGLTTAAGLWLVSAIGLAAGAGMYVESVAVTGFGLVVLTVVQRLEGRGIGRRRIAVVTKDAAAAEAARAAIEALGGRVATLRQESDRREGGGRVETTFDVRLADRLATARVVAAIEAAAPVEQVRVEVEA